VIVTMCPRGAEASYNAQDLSPPTKNYPAPNVNCVELKSSGPEKAIDWLCEGYFWSLLILGSPRPKYYKGLLFIGR
jgi:hypothetical protein